MPPSDQPTWPHSSDQDPDATRPQTPPLYINHHDVLGNRSPATTQYGQATVPAATKRQPRRMILLIVIAAIVMVSAIAGGYYLGKQGSRSTPPPLTGITTQSPVGTMVTRVVATATVSPPIAVTTPPMNSATCTNGSFTGAVAASTNSTHFSRVTFPPNTYSLPAATTEADGVISRIIPSCTTQITSDTALKQLFSTTLTDWTQTTAAQEQAANSYVGQGCTDGCWKIVESQLLGQPVAHYIALANIIVNGGVITYTVRLTIAPLWHEIRTLMQGSAIALEHTGLEDIQWSDAIHPANNALAGQLDVDFASATYAYITGPYLQKGLVGKLTVIPQVVNTAVVLKDNRGHYAKFIIQGAVAGQVTLLVIVYAYGF